MTISAVEGFALLVLGLYAFIALGARRPLSGRLDPGLGCSFIIVSAGGIIGVAYRAWKFNEEFLAPFAVLCAALGVVFAIMWWKGA